MVKKSINSVKPEIMLIEKGSSAFSGVFSSKKLDRKVPFWDAILQQLPS